MSVQYRNSTNGDSRRVFVKGGPVVIVTTYHENIGLTAKPKVIHRYLPRIHLGAGTKKRNG